MDFMWEQMALNGSTRRVDWKSWRHEAKVTLLWEVKRILPDVGLVSRSHKTKVCNCVRAREETWRYFVQLMGWASDECYGRSTTAVKLSAARASRDVPAEFEPEYWMSNRMVLVFIFMKRTTKGMTEREQIADLGDLLWQRVCNE